MSSVNSSASGVEYVNDPEESVPTYSMPRKAPASTDWYPQILDGQFGRRILNPDQAILLSSIIVLSYWNQNSIQKFRQMFCVIDYYMQHPVYFYICVSAFVPVYSM